MEQFDPAGTPSTVSLQRRRLLPPPNRPSSPKLASSEPSPCDTLLQDLGNSVPSLRFPRPLGNRQLTNWVSSSSPDIMQPGNIMDDDPSLTELGYDIIGTDGESQAESVASSFDYQRPDDVQSLAGTDTGTDVDTNEVDTYSSDEEDVEETMLNSNSSPQNPVDSSDSAAEDEEADIETLANQSLENPTSFSQHAVSPFHPLSLAEQSQAQDLLASMREFSPQGVMSAFEQSVRDVSPTFEKKPKPPYLSKTERQSPQVIDWTRDYIRKNLRTVAIVSAIAILYSLALVGKSIMFDTSTPRELATVPVASVSSVGVPVFAATPQSLCTSSTSLLLTTTQQQYNSKTETSTGILKPTLAPDDSPQTGTSGSLLQQTVCSAGIHGRNEILVNIPQGFKSSWLSRDAILIAVSRGLQDIPTKVSSVDEGFLIEVPVKEAYGVLSVSIATTRKPKINESFRVNFGNHKFTEAFDAGRQLVKGFAQKFVDTVNETTAWVEETYIPAFDVVSKQVCEQTASASDLLIQGLRDAGNTVLSFPAMLISEISNLFHQPVDREVMTERADQALLEITRQAQDARDELRMTLLHGQLNSKLLWLKLQGKTAEYRHYLDKAEVYWNERRSDADVAKAARAERVKKHIRARRKSERQTTKGSFWHKAAARS
ncbi:hypothetical protein F5Y15DRAFT_109171 [Xylariaceae sp. FL0016]|nr:hypothetical protein F5Y15DRAFT_109171 [Xylariaceae sp. FL0016]